MVKTCLGIIDNGTVVTSPIIRTSFNKMIQSRKTFLYSRADTGEYHSQTQTDIPHDCTSHQSPSFVLYGC